MTCPKVSFGRDGLDFGMGFYATELLEQAWKWADRISRQRAEKAVVSMYSFDDEKAAKKYRMLRFDAYDSDWLKFIVACRGGYNPSDQYDYVEGGVANDRVVDTVEGYINGTVDESHAIVELAKHQPNHQICFLNQQVIDECLTFEKSI